MPALRKGNPTGLPRQMLAKLNHYPTVGHSLKFVVWGPASDSQQARDSGLQVRYRIKRLIFELSHRHR